MRYKYRINHLLSLLPAGIYPESITANLEIIHHIDAHIFYRDRHIAIEALEEIPDERLRIYAQVFDVQVSDLKTAIQVLTN